MPQSGKKKGGIDLKQFANEGAQRKGRILMSKDAIEWNEVHRSEQQVEAVCFGE